MRHQRSGLAVVGAVTAILLPFLPIFRAESKQFLLALVVVYAIVAVSLTILTGWGGQVSLGHFAFIGVGAYTSARLVPEGWSLLSTMFVAGLSGAVIAVIVGVPALRLPGLTLAVPTLGLALVAPAWLFTQSWFGQPGSIVVSAPSLAGLGAVDTTRGTYFLSVAVLALTIASASAYRRSRAGRLLVAVRDNPTSVAAHGISPTSVRLGAFALSGFIASVAGVLWVTAFRNVAPPLFGAEQSFLMLSIVVIGGLGSLAGSVLGSALIFGVPIFASDLLKSVFPNTLAFTLFLSGLGLVITQMRYPGGLATTFRAMWQRFLYAVAAARDARALGEEAMVPLTVRDARKAFGGVAALAGATITVREGEIVGLIGSNGAGKSTLMDVISGLVRPDSGTVAIFGHQMSGLPAEARAHVGVGRGFQEAALYPGLTVRETIQVALARTSRVGAIAAALGAPWARSSERRTRHRAEELLSRFGLEPWKDVVTADLSTGTRRICELAAQAAASPRLLLLDEPTAGVAQRDAEAFAPLLLRLRDEFGCSVLLVEHDMPLRLSVADRVYCLERGVVIAEGTPAEIRRDPAVVASYLGTTPAAIERSGGVAPRRGRPRQPRAALARSLVSTKIERGDE